MTVKRYYAQHCELQNMFWHSTWQTGWQVFDREHTIGHTHSSQVGEVAAIAFCMNRNQAYKIRDALNKDPKANP